MVIAASVGRMRIGVAVRDVHHLVGMFLSGRIVRGAWWARGFAVQYRRRFHQLPHRSTQSSFPSSSMCAVSGAQMERTSIDILLVGVNTICLGRRVAMHHGLENSRQILLVPPLLPQPAEVVMVRHAAVKLPMQAELTLRLDVNPSPARFSRPNTEMVSS
ncbi:hypothetical protein [uncultured Xanthomonas sp.]|uniref:hypothetical protein n=1 Tax=uncultured Xanthomonas sp. TaxID=152831 RepID=UPI0025DFA963|nr:hypothetical protein [uncultured Xanthomonas sp.]